MNTSEQRSAGSARGTRVDGPPPTKPVPPTKPLPPTKPVPPIEPVQPIRFMTVAEVAATMRVSKMTVYRMVHSGELPAVRVGRSFRVHEQTVLDFLNRAYIEAG